MAPPDGAEPHEHADHAGGEGHEGHQAHEGHGDHATMTHRFEDAEKWAARFDDPARDAWQKPAQVIRAMGVTEGQVVADLGAGTGYLVPHLTNAVGPSGRVIAVDVEPTLVEHMVNRFEGQTQVEVRQTPPVASGLKRSEVDHVVLLDVFHHISNRVDYFGKLRTSLKPGGVLTVVDFDPSATGEHGPPAAHRLALAKVSSELEDAGWLALPPVDETLDEQYIGRFVVGQADADVTWLAAALERGGVQLVDVRTEAEFAGGRVPGARNIPLPKVGAGPSDFDKERPVVLICRSGARSSRAAMVLSGLGYQTINVTGGTNAWVQAGHPVEQ